MSERRRGIYNKLRRCKNPDEISLLKDERDGISDQIKDLRNDVKIANQVLKRSEIMKEDLMREQAAQQKEKQRSRGYER